MNNNNDKLAAALLSLGRIIAMLALFGLGFYLGRASIGWQIAAAFGH